MACVVYTSRNCPRCEVLKQFLQNHRIEYKVQNIEEPEAKVDALMLNIYSTPALVIGNNVFDQTMLFQNNRLKEDTILTLLRSN